MQFFGKKEDKKKDKQKDEKKSAPVRTAKKAKSASAKATADKPAAKKSMKELYGAGKEKVSAAPAAGPEGKSSLAKASASAKATADKSSFAKASEDKSEDRPEAKKDSSASSAYRVLLRPLVTEKGSHLGVENKYLFEVDYHTNKIEVAKAIESAYGIRPTKVNIIKLAGKVVRRGKYEGRRKNWKKAIVTLPKGKTIQIYEGI